MIVFEDKPVIGLVHLASRCLLAADSVTIGAALAHCASQLRLINQARHRLIESNYSGEREAAIAELLNQLHCLGPKDL